MKSRVLVIGTVGIDMVCPLPFTPLPGQTAFGEGFELLPGGKAMVSAVTVAEMGIEPILCAAVGDDEEGKRLFTFCRALGLDTRFLYTVKDAQTAMRIMLAEENTSPRTCRFQGAAAMLTTEMLEDAFTCLPDALYLQGDLPSELLYLAAGYAKEQDIPIFFDPGDATVIHHYDRLGPLEIFTPSEEDVRMLTGSQLRTQDEIMRACIALANIVPSKYYVLKLGSRGAMLYDGTYYKFSSAYDVEPVDSCGVGDIHSAILSAEYMLSGDIKRAMEYANAGAALSITKRGSISSIPRREQVIQVVNDNMEDYK